jgi:hypothetical protein
VLLQLRHPQQSFSPDSYCPTHSMIALKRFAFRQHPCCSTPTNPPGDRVPSWGCYLQQGIVWKCAACGFDIHTHTRIRILTSYLRQSTQACWGIDSDLPHWSLLCNGFPSFWAGAEAQDCRSPCQQASTFALENYLWVCWLIMIHDLGL